MNSFEDIRTDPDLVDPVSGLQVFRYHGRSMWPTFREGDLLIVKPIEFAKIRRGDCIVYQKEGEKSVVHRVVAIEPNIITQGDNRPICDDEAIKEEWVLGRVSSCIRGKIHFNVRGGVLSGLLARGVYILRILRSMASRAFGVFVQAFKR